MFRLNLVRNTFCIFFCIYQAADNFLRNAVFITWPIAIRITTLLDINLQLSLLDKYREMSIAKISKKIAYIQAFSLSVLCFIMNKLFSERFILFVKFPCT